MAVKNLIGPGFIGSTTVRYIITRGLNTAQSMIPVIAEVNTLMGDVTDEVYRQGVALTGFTFVLINKSTGAAITSGGVTCKVLKDGGSQSTSTNSAAHEGNGQWSITLTATEMDAEQIGLAITHSTALPLYKTFRTV
tara:strand:- start:634 stop:1044 length:411 start_codon:yes stop_codon:yes gene_type:complete